MRRSSVDGLWPFSPAGTRPRCRSGTASDGSCGRDPRVGRPVASWMAAAVEAACASLPTRFRITPASRTPGWRRRLTINTFALNAFLLCRDALVAQMKPRSRRLLLGLIMERSQAELARQEGISQSAVSQNLSSSGAYAIKAAELELEERLL